MLGDFFKFTMGVLCIGISQLSYAYKLIMRKLRDFEAVFASKLNKLTLLANKVASPFKIISIK